MENIYLLIIIILFILAISDLIVGVSNDAVNFLNSAIGSKVAPFKVIMIIASLGVIVGALFSNGMMEIARKGIFNPEKFYYTEILYIFLAVMITDVILLDIFNTYGLPTSTTVSIIFELLGASVAFAVIKISHNAADGATIADYINTNRAILIISGILVSVVISFAVGSIVQAITRIIFSFNYEKTYKYFGAMFGGLAISAITYFIIIKGAKGASFLTEDTIAWFHQNTGRILLFSFIGWTAILQLLILLFRTNVFKIIVLFGTFSLAMAFAGNDLVNFIGAPLAGFESFRIFNASGSVDPGSFTMEALSGKIQTPTLFLLIAGLVMVATLWFSKKAKTVTKTSLDLSRQDEGDERFGSSLLARVVVREGMRIGKAVGSIVPKPLSKAISSRFEQSNIKKKKEKTSFDLIRASVNLIVSAALIAIGTSYKLPLSTTYVTFMVAMATSFSDGAWNRESAVYRVTGVFTVIGGWFLTAFVAFTATFIIAFIIHWGEIYAITGFMIIAAIIIWRTHIIHKKSYKDEAIEATEDILDMSESSTLKKCHHEVTSFYKNSSKNLYEIINALIKDKRKPLVRIKEQLKEDQKHLEKIKKKAHRNLSLMSEKELEHGYFYLGVIDQLEIAFVNQKEIFKLVFDHVDNNHSSLKPDQNKDLSEFIDSFVKFENKLIQLTDKPDKDLKKIKEHKESFIEEIEKLQKNNIKQLRKENVSTKTSMMFQGMMTEMKQYIHNTFELLVTYKKYIKEVEN